MDHVMVALRRFVRDDDGQDLLEYGMLVVLIAVAAVISVTTLGDAISTTFWNVIAAQNF